MISRKISGRAPSYFARRPKPKDPKDLTAHDCINIRLPTYGGIYAWEFEKRGRALKVRVEGESECGAGGIGPAYLYEDQVQEHVAEGRLVRVLSDWCPPFSGYHLYYPSRRQAAPAFALLVEALRYAVQVANAIENTRLLNELRESLQQQAATSEVLQGHQQLTGRARAGVRGAMKWCN
jgi:DNA-binding transcriptional LysR family regulator